MNAIVGHTDILAFFNKINTAGSLGHAYCFVGQRGIGKRTVAEHVASTVLGVDRSKLTTHLDFFLVQQELNEKTGKTKKNIDIEQIRSLRTTLSQQPFLGKYKVAIIRDADKMNVNAANALLKTLEEPKAHTVLFLTTTDEAQLPQTIQSRCQMVHFQPVATGDIAAVLQQQGTTENDAMRMAAYATGCPGRALQWAQDRDVFDSYANEVQRFTKLIGKPFYEKIALVDELYGDKTDHIAAREHLKHVLRRWQVFVRDIALGKNRAVHDMPAQQWSADTVVTIQSHIRRAITLLDHNIHPRLLVEHILFAIP